MHVINPAMPSRLFSLLKLEPMVTSRCSLRNCGDEGHLSEFLLSQHMLRGLDVDWAEDKRDLIARSCCPQLRVLCGDRATLETFLPSREITPLDWTQIG